MLFLSLAIGGITLIKIWQNDTELRQTALRVIVAVRAHFAMLLISLLTILSVSILSVVALHMITE